ncbi:AAA family ATPase [Methanolobus halotolerans]|uniref:Replication factor C small subunit n=1 Tax=Methanolobus halotolerans TaxID=2052935 RepID=A0A4E0PXV9_9EURY|nr:AAA family ATPase [Methanolobus halotolerans]TGC10974.1 replication protein C [Methanolobus halotolerans]
MRDIWTVKYRPAKLDDIVGNEGSIDTMRKLLRSKNLPHLVLYGPVNTGKSSAAFAMANEIYGDDYQRNFTYFNASDFFEQGKRYIVRDKRFTRIIGTDDPSKINKSVISIFKEVINEYASMGPLDADYKVIFIDNAESLNSDAQHALRRMMERYTATCRFVLSTTQASKLIAPLRSRGLQLFFTHVSDDKLAAFIRDVADAEGLPLTNDGVDALGYHAKGNIAKALHTLQLASVSFGDETIGAKEIYDSTLLDRSENISHLFNAAVSKDIIEGRKAIDALILEEGMSGQEILLQLHQMAINSNESDPVITEWVIRMADTDFYMTEAANERIQLEALVVRFCQ